MYPLPVILVGCGEPVRGNVRRELGNQLACVRAEYRDVDDLLQALKPAADDDPVLFLMHLRGADDLRQLQRLSGAFPGKPVLALRDRSGDAALFHGALRAGAAFAVPVPLDPEDFRIALQWISKECGFAPRTCTVVAVAGVSGGCGASTLALNLAHEFGAKFQRRALLVELALRMGTLATYLHVEPTFNIHHLLEKRDEFDMDFVRQAVVEVNDHLGLLAGPQQAIQSRAVAPADLLHVVQYARALADVAVLDVPCTYDDLYFETLAAADKVVLVWEQKVASVRALQMVRDALHLRKVPARNQTLVVNRYDARLKGFTTADLEGLLHLTGLRTVANDYAAISAALDHGRPLRAEAPQSPALADIDALAGHLLGLSAAPGAAGKDRSNVFGRLVRAFGLTS